MNQMLFIVIIIVSFMLPSASLGYSGGSGEPNEPYQIATKADLLELASTAEDYNKCFILTADINMQDQVFTTAIIAADTNSDSGFQGINFTGIFDGNNHKVTKFTIDGGSNDYLGLFGRIDSGGSVKNMGVESFTVSGNNAAVSGLAGTLYGNSSTIANCYSKGEVSGDRDVGGLVGANWGGDISSSYSTGTVEGNEYLGGLVGYNWAGYVTDCCSTVAVRGVSKCIAGLVGENKESRIKHSCASGTVNGSSYFSKCVGGLVGFNWSGDISNCYSTGDVSGPQVIGGLVGSSDEFSNITNCYATGDVNASSGIDSCAIGGLVGSISFLSNITNCYSTSSVSSSDSETFDMGGLVGQSWCVTIANCYAVGKVDGIYGIGGFVGRGIYCEYSACFWNTDINPDVNGIGNASDPNVIGLPTITMQQRSTFAEAGWDFIEIWNIGENQTYPFLRTYLPSDINMDGETNFYDLAILASHWLQQE